MRSISILPFVALATALVLPDIQVFEQLSLDGGRNEEPVEFVPAKFVHSDSGTVLDEEEGSDAADWAQDGGHGHHPHGPFDLTIYQLLSLSNRTTKFLELVNEHDSIIKLLNSTAANYTLFVPTDDAFEHAPHHGDKKPSKEFIESLLKYHIGVGAYPTSRLRWAFTIPTALDESLLGDQPQRLRARTGIIGPTQLNFITHVVGGNVAVRNGVVHAINRPLLPPAFVGRELSLFPARFSTLLLAYEKTNFVDFIHHVTLRGSTVFAPDNDAFRRLGPRANAFLFNTERGRGYLRALLKYQIVANATLYSDALYRADGVAEAIEADEVPAEEDDVVAEILGGRRYHVDLPTLLGDTSVSVDVTRLGRLFSRIVVNRRVRVSVQDAVAKNGVIQVVSGVPIPPHKHHGAWDQRMGPIEVEDLIERLEDYVEEEDSREESWDDL